LTDELKTIKNCILTSHEMATMTSRAGCFLNLFKVWKYKTVHAFF